MDVATGKLLDQLKDPNLTTICPVNKPHPRLDCIISGSSRSLYCWRPMPQGTQSHWQVHIACQVLLQLHS